MTIALWILNIVLALVFLGAGVMHAFRPVDKLVESGMGWAGDMAPGLVKTIGILEILGAVGLIVPRATGLAPILTPIAAIGLAIVMVGAIPTHIRRKEPFTFQLVLGLLSVASAVLGFLVVR